MKPNPPTKPSVSNAEVRHNKTPTISFDVHTFNPKNGVSATLQKNNTDKIESNDSFFPGHYNINLDTTNSSRSHYNVSTQTPVVTTFNSSFGTAVNSTYLANNNNNNTFPFQTFNTNIGNNRLAGTVGKNATGSTSSVSSSVSPVTKPILPPFHSLTSGINGSLPQPLFPPNIPQASNDMSFPLYSSKIASPALSTENNSPPVSYTRKSSQGLDENNDNRIFNFGAGLKRTQSYQSMSKSPHSHMNVSGDHDLSNDELFHCLNINSDDSVNVYEGGVPMLYRFSRINNLGPLAWISSLLKDPFVRPLRDEVVRHKRKSLSNETLENGLDNESRMLSYLGLDDIKPLNVEVQLSDKIEVHCQEKNEAPCTSKQYVCDDVKLHSNQTSFYYNVNLALHEILKVLPNKKVIWLSIKRYFSHVYPILPYLDQSSFIDDIERLTGSNHFSDRDSEEMVQSLKISKKLDFATLGTLLLVFKFSELSLVVIDDPGDSSIVRTKEEQYLLQHQTSSTVVNVAQRCLNQFKLLRRCALPIFQLALLMNEYEKMNGSADGNSADSLIFTAMLIQVGIATGLNRDPSKFNIQISNGKMGNLWRKIWYGLISLDIKKYIQSGSGKKSHCDFFDTELPIFDEESANIDNYDLERVTIEKIKLNYKFDKLMADLTDYLCNFRKEPKMKEILEMLFQLENLIALHFGTLKDLLNKKTEFFVEKIRKVWDFTIYIQASALLVSVYHHIFVYYQKKGNFRITKFVEDKSLMYWHYFYANFENLAKKPHKYFGTGFDMLIGQCVLLVIHRGWINNISTYIQLCVAIEKSNSSIVNNKKNKIMRKIYKIFSESKLWYLPSLKILSGKHFNAWKLLKAHSFLIEMVNKNQLIFKPLHNLYNYVDDMSETDLIGRLEITKYSNFSAEGKETEYFKKLKRSILEHNSINLEKNVSYDEVSQMSSNYTGTESNSGSDFSKTDEFGNPIVPVKGYRAKFPIESWNQPIEEDALWKGVYLQKQENQKQQCMFPSTTSFLRDPNMAGFDLAQPISLSETNEETDDVNSVNWLPTTNTAGPSTDSTGAFVDRTIYEMFN